MHATVQHNSHENQFLYDSLQLDQKIQKYSRYMPTHRNTISIWNVGPEENGKDQPTDAEWYYWQGLQKLEKKIGWKQKHLADEIVIAWD